MIISHFCVSSLYSLCKYAFGEHSVTDRWSQIFHFGWWLIPIRSGPDQKHYRRKRLHNVILSTKCLYKWYTIVKAMERNVRIMWISQNLWTQSHPKLATNMTNNKGFHRRHLLDRWVVSSRWTGQPTTMNGAAAHLKKTVTHCSSYLWVYLFACRPERQRSDSRLSGWSLCSKCNTIEYYNRRAATPPPWAFRRRCRNLQEFSHVSTSFLPS